MLIIWRGFGWLVPVIVIGAFFAVQMALDALFGENLNRANDWPQSLSVGVSALLLGALGYYLNYKKRWVYEEPGTGDIIKSPMHTFFFVPIQIWAIIVPALFFGMQYVALDTRAQELALIESPERNDKYAVDFSAIFSDIESRHKFGIMRVVSVEPDGVILAVSELAYNKRAGVRKDLRDGKANQPDYYSSEPISVSRDALRELKESGAIFSVSREKIVRKVNL